MDTSDKILIKLAKSGSKQAFEILVRKYHQPISRFAYGIIGDNQKAADISQTVFIKFYTLLPNFEITDAKLSTWLFKVAKNQCLNEISVSKRIVPLIDDLSDKKDTEGQIIERLDLFDALNSLDMEHKQAFILVNLEGFSYQEVGEILSIPVGTVKSRIFNARKILIQKLSNKEMV